VRDVNLETDMKDLLEIYNYYVSDTIVTFDLSLASDTHFESKLCQGHPFFVLLVNDKVCGYAYTSPFRAKPAYNLTCELSIYLHKDFGGRGFGQLSLSNFLKNYNIHFHNRLLMEELLDKLKSLKFHSVVGGISLPNEKSVKLHERNGFEKVAHFREVGFKFGNYIDVAFYERIL
jgi:L-amino acid N-acyltransferase YncA